MTDVILVHEWDNDAFHRRVMELESRGYVAQRETYKIMADVNPDTGEVIHLYTIDMYKPDEKKRVFAPERTEDSKNSL